VIPKQSRPQLTSKVRLRFDRHGQKHMLLFPERGLILNQSAAAIARLCTGEHTLEQIVERLQVERAGATREQIESDVQVFIAALLERALIRIVD
jgi:pyrroloquinoline quinone biosynthesis protein D